MKPIANLHFISHDGVNSPSHLYQIEQALLGGVTCIQFRIKYIPSIDFLYETAQQARELTKKYNAQLIINDYVDVALEVGADGIHLGADDMSIQEAREELGADTIIGATAHTIKELQLAIDNGADYIGIGPFKPSETKKNLPDAQGIEGLSDMINSVNNPNNIPYIAIGGILLSDVKNLIEMGCNGVAVSSKIALAQNIKDAAHWFKFEVDKRIYA